MNEVQISMFLPRAADITIRVYDAFGREVMTPQITAGVTGTNAISVQFPQDLAAGIYVMQIESGGKVWSQKVSKQTP